MRIVFLERLTPPCARFAIAGALAAVIAALSVPFGSAANLTISDLTITGGSLAGISWYQGLVTIIDTHVTGNAGTGIGNFGGGGAIIERSVVSGTISNNSAGIAGGGIYNAEEKHLDLATVTFSGNSPDDCFGLGC